MFLTNVIFINRKEMLCISETEYTKEMYYIFYKGYIEKGNQRHPDNHILIFPTPEMRNAFYENFNDLIEECKELL